MRDALMQLSAYLEVELSIGIAMPASLSAMLSPNGHLSASKLSNMVADRFGGVNMRSME